MSTYLYGLVLRRHATLLNQPGEGIEGSPIRALDCEDLAAIVSDVSAAITRPSLDAVQMHDAVLQLAVDAGVTTAAARFGQSFGDDDACRRHVLESGERVRQTLTEHDGCVEMRILLHVQRDAVERSKQPDSPGRAYLEQIRETRDRVVRLGVRADLGSLVRAEKVDELPRSGIAISHLVQRTDVDAWRNAVRLVPRLAGARLIGPMALYAFAP